MQKPPRLYPGQVSLLQTDVKSGITLDINGEFYLGTGARYITYDSLYEAENFANQKLEMSPDLEFVFYDDHGKFIKMINRFGTRINSKK